MKAEERAEILYDGDGIKPSLHTLAIEGRRSIAIDRITEAIQSAVDEAREDERKRATSYMEKLAWSTQDIQAFLDWGSPSEKS